MKLIVGLGNPGKEYENTRHNVGFMVLDHYLGSVSWKYKFNGYYYEKNVSGEKVLFLKPKTYMNLSGNSVIQFVHFYKIKIEDILVIQDDLDLPYLKYRLKYNSSAGGHNGIKSLIDSLGTQAIPRLKIGIAHDRFIDTKDYVLSKFSKQEIKFFAEKAEIFSAVIDFFISEGIESCMRKTFELVVA